MQPILLTVLTSYSVKAMYKKTVYLILVPYFKKKMEEMKLAFDNA